MRIALATANPGKIEEIKAIINLPGIEWLVRGESDRWPEVIENGTSFLANAVKKAATIAEFTNAAALADDSGLEVRALGGRPGINTARYAGKDATDEANVAQLLRELQEVEQTDGWQARFVSVVVFVANGRTISAKGVCDGTIAQAPRGSFGFGYDPVFIPRGFDRTMAELSPAEKNSLSHRRRALDKVRGDLELMLRNEAGGQGGRVVG